jgi:hypothetical protein
MISDWGFQTTLFRGFGGLEEEGDGGAGRARVPEGLAIAPDAEEGFLVFEVVHDDGDGAVGVEGGSSDELVAGRGAGDAFGAGADETRELAEDVVWGIEGEFAGSDVSVDDRAGALADFRLEISDLRGAVVGWPTVRPSGWTAGLATAGTAKRLTLTAGDLHFS